MKLLPELYLQGCETQANRPGISQPLIYFPSHDVFYMKDLLKGHNPDRPQDKRINSIINLLLTKKPAHGSL